MLTSEQVLSTYFLDTRCKLIEIAAMLDRIDRAAAADSGGNGHRHPTAANRDERLSQLYGALQLLAEPIQPQMNRSEQLLLMFSDLA